MKTKPPYPYVHEFTDRHGRPRLYFRRPGFKRVSLPWPVGSREFVVAYEAAKAATPLPVGAGRVKAGTIDALVQRYYQSGEFRQLAPSTQATYRGIIERFRAEHGDKSVAALERRHVKAMIDKKAATPAAANNFLRMVRLLMRYAIDLEWRRDDPTIGIRNLRTKGGGYHTWTESEIEAFERTHGVGSRARLALALLLYTGQRRSDVVKMGWQHVEAPRIRVKQQKTGARLAIWLHPELADILDATPLDDLTFLRTQSGEPFTPAGFGNWFRECCDAAGLRHCSAHGLRKAAARRLAEAGCSSHEIMAVTGHQTLKEVERYTREAERKRLGDSAIRKLLRENEEQELANQAEKFANDGAKPLKPKEN
ncbi:tyrosine-type recombinase/integrase [Afifella sp. YEN Y35]|uniref:tyrosine-type recombinase/integrase n=1 Tax=Afifella sp. YEN Y35 TaxID=3388337 RepID=UPI0039E04129